MKGRTARNATWQINKRIQNSYNNKLLKEKTRHYSLLLQSAIESRFIVTGALLQERTLLHVK